jgi:glycosyltransferase involved in cell wall biosynthesis
MRIALLWPDCWPYVRRGTERMVHDISRYLAEQGHEVHILTSKPGAGAVNRAGPITTICSRRVEHPLLRRYRAAARFDAHGLAVIPQLLRGGYDLIHAFTYQYAMAIGLARRIRNVPIVYHVAMSPPYVPRPLDRRLLRLCLALRPVVRVFSRYSAGEVVELTGMSPVVVPPSVDTDTFRPRGAKDAASPRVLFTADLADPVKGAQVMARAFNEIHQRCPRATLQLAGPVGPHTPSIKPVLQLIEPSARAAVEVLGPGSLARLPSLYSEAAVTVLPSLGEAFGMVLTESLASGTPVVGASSGAIPEIITDPAIGTLFERTADDERSARDLAGAVLRTLELAHDPATVERCRHHAGQWTWPALGPRFDRLHDLARRHPGADRGVA